MLTDEKTFAALANKVRLSVFRLLVERGSDGLPAGHIAMRLSLPASTLSTHLAQLERAGLLRSWREQQRIMYSIDVEGTKNLIEFLVDDCCGGHPEICGFKRAPNKRSRVRGKRESETAM